MAQPPNAQSPVAEQVPGWVLRRLENTLEYKDGVRYESSLYGPLLSLLTSIFVVNQMFMIKPQGLLRVEFDRKLCSDVGSIGTDEDMDMSNLDDVDGVSDFQGMMEMEARAGDEVEDSLSERVNDQPKQHEGLEDAHDLRNEVVGLAPMYYSEADVTTDSHRGFVSSKELGSVYEYPYVCIY
jgi:hypothetical protein